MRRLVASILVALLASTPPAAASAEADAGVVVVRVQDNHGEDCAPSVASACLVNVTGADDPGDATIDASQRVQYVGVASNATFLTPEVDENVSGGELYVRYPIIRTAAETYHSIPQDRPHRDAAGVVLNETGYGIYYQGPSPAAPTGPSGNRTAGFEWGDGGGFSSPNYEQIGPFNTPCCATTDGLTRVDGIVCTYVDEATCAAFGEHVEERRQGVTPNVVFGFTWDEVQVATDPEDLSSLAPGARLSSAPAPLHRERADAPPGGARAKPWAAPATGAPAPRDADAPAAPRAPAADGSALASLKALASDGGRSRAPLALVATVAATAALLALLAALLYSRFRTRDELLLNETRARILEMARQTPGILIADLAKALGVARSTVVYHVSHLENMKLARRVLFDGRQHVYLPGQAPPDDIKAIGRVQRSILQVLERSPEGCTRAQIQEALAGVPKPSRNEAIRKLLRRSVIQEATTERGLVLRVAARAQDRADGG